MKAQLARPAAAPQAPRPAAPAATRAAPGLASMIGNRAMRQAVAGTNVLPRSPRSPALAVQRAPSIRDASHGDSDGPRAPWDRAGKQQASLDALASGTADRGQGDFVIEEARKQVPDVAYMEQVAAGARTVLTLIVPGNGPLGVKTLNDDVVGYQINNSMIAPQRNEAVKHAFLHGGRGPTAALPFVVTEQTYKSTTVTSDLPPQQLRTAMQQVLHAIDRDVPAVYLRGLEYGLTYWKTDRTGEDTNEHREAARRVANIEDAIERVKAPGFQLEFQFGMAAIEHGAGGEPPGYASALAARMQSSQAALMSRDLDRGSTPDTDTDIGDRRGQIYNRNVFLQFCDEGEALRRQVIRSGNTLTHHDHQYRVFAGPQANRDVVRDVRKGKIEEEDLASPGEVLTLHLFQRYFRHVNAFDNIREFTSKEVDHVGDQIQRAQRLIDSLKDGGPVDARAVTQTLHANPGMGGVIPKTETASAAVFFNAERHRTHRIIVSGDVRDMGVDLVQYYGTAMHRVGSGREDPDLVAQQASDPMDQFRRQIIQRMRQRYRALVRGAIATAEQRGNHALAHQLRAELEPSLLMGGDEITLSLHEGMRPYVAPLAAALADPNVTRARVAISTTGKNPAHAVEDHILAQQRADPAHSVLKNFEAMQRDLELMVGEIGDPARKHRGAALVHGLKLHLLYAANEGRGIVLRRHDTNAVVAAEELRRRIDDVKLRLRELSFPMLRIG